MRKGTGSSGLYYTGSAYGAHLRLVARTGRLSQPIFWRYCPDKSLLCNQVSFSSGTIVSSLHNRATFASA